MKRLIALFVLCALVLSAQGITSKTMHRFRKAASEPAACNPGEAYYNTTSDTGWLCTATDTWTVMGATSGSVGGADNLTTVGAIPYVSAAGVLNEDTPNLFWDFTNNRLGLGTLVPVETLHAWGGNIEVTDPTDLGSESLTDPTDFTDDADWDYTGEVAAVGTDAVYTFSSTGNGTITQVNAQMAVVGVGYRWYKAVHVVSSSTVAGAAVTITSAFASAATALATTDGTHTTYFQAASGAATAAFVINITGATSGAFTLESMSIKEVQGGDVIAGGLYTGGGPTGIKVLASGRVGIGVVPTTKFEVYDGDVRVSDDGTTSVTIDSITVAGQASVFLENNSG